MAGEEEEEDFFGGEGEEGGVVERGFGIGFGSVIERGGRRGVDGDV